MTHSARTTSTAMWVGVGVLIAGRLCYLWWHPTQEVYEHSQLRDSDLPHFLLTVSQLVLLTASPLAALSLRVHPTAARHG